jgi:hypothetical protein
MLGAGRVAFKRAATMVKNTGAVGRVAAKLTRTYNNSRLWRFGGVDGAIERASRHPSYRGLQYATFGMTQLVEN